MSVCQSVTLRIQCLISMKLDVPRIRAMAHSNGIAEGIVMKWFKMC